MTAQSPAEMIGVALADLSNNRPAETILRALERLDANALPPRERAQLGLARGIAKNRNGEAHDALGEFMDARAVCDDHGLTDVSAEISRQIGIAHSWRGEVRAAAAAFFRCLTDAVSIPDRKQQAMAILDFGRLNIEAGVHADAADMLAKGLAAGEGVLDPREWHRAKGTMVQALVRIKEYAKARDECERWCTDGATQRVKLLKLMEEVRIAAGFGDVARARELLEILNTSEGADGTYEALEIAHVAAEVALATNEPDRALELLSAVLDKYDQDQSAPRQIMGRLLRAEAQSRLGLATAAYASLTEAFRIAKSRSLDGYVALAREALVLSASQGGSLLTLEDEGERHDTRFVSRERLGEGGFAIVDRVFDLITGQEVVLKRLKGEPLSPSQRRAAVKSEVKALRSLIHPGVARIHGLVSGVGGELMMALEMVEGPTLRDLMADPGLRLRAPECLSQIASALAAIHKAGLVYCDLKPENIVMRHSQTPVLLDFGAAVFWRQSPGAPAPAFSEGYAPPEQINGAPAHPSMDIYAFGATAFELICGERTPPRGTSFWSSSWAATSRKRLLQAGASAELTEFCMLCLSLEPEKRPIDLKRFDAMPVV